MAQDQHDARDSPAARQRPPSVDAVLRTQVAERGIATYGRPVVVAAVRTLLDEARTARRPAGSAETIAERAVALAQAESRPSQRPVFNLTGTVLHTNLGRAVLAECARLAALDAMSSATNLEYDVAAGKRGDRDDHVRGLLTELTGAEDAIAVNNNAAAVILTLNTLATGKETIVSRGELVEIGGAFRMPDIMARAGTRLVEVGTTNRTHPRDYREAIGPQTALLMKVHTSNFLVQGFTAEVAHKEVAGIAHEHGLPFVDDLGSGVLVDLTSYGLAAERTVQAALGDGADLVTFSGDKLLGGPQAGLIVGRKDLVRQLAKNPLRRALRMDRMRLAALEATLRLYRNPATLAEQLPTLRYLTRTRTQLTELGHGLVAPVSAALGDRWSVRTADCESETGSGALPLATVPSAGIEIAAADSVQQRGGAMEALAAAFRALPRPVIGRIHDNRLIFDLRCLEDTQAFVAQLQSLSLPADQDTPA